MTAKKTTGKILIQDVVKEVLNDMNIYSLENYIRYLKFAIRGYTKLNLFDLTNFQVAYLTMSDVGTVDLPRDYVDYTKIGYKGINGTIYILGLNNEMYLNRSTECGLPINNVLGGSMDETSDYFYFVPHTINGCRTDALYGLGGGFADSYYRVDKENDLIQFSNKVPGGEIILEYISSGISVNGSTYIPLQAVEAVIAWIHWKRKQHTGTFNFNEIESAKRVWEEERNAVRDFENAFTFQEIMDVFYESYKQTTKR